MTGFRRFAQAARNVSVRKRTTPTKYISWLPLQHEFLSSQAKIKQIRAGNQTIGKSWCAIAEVIGRCRGVHPIGAFQYPMPPIEAWIICSSWSQSLGIQAKLNALLPKSELDPRTSYDSVNGFAPTKSPVVLFTNGSMIRIKTTGQDTLDFAGATIQCVLFDEPPRNARMYTEALQRLEELGGTLLLSYTPINAPTEYLKELVDNGQIEDHWRMLTPAEMIPVGETEPLFTKDGRPKDEAYITARLAKVPMHERGVVVHGQWETKLEDAYFGPVFRHTEHISELALSGPWHVRLGIDHGHQPGKQVALLVLTRKVGDFQQVYVVDEYIDRKGTAKPEDDARSILAMVRRNGIDWHQVDTAYGDRIHMKGHQRQKSNQQLTRHIADILEVNPRALKPQISTVKRGEGHGAGSVEAGTRWLYHCIARPGNFVMHPRCVAGKSAFDRYVKPRDDDRGSKDWIDALRYALDDLIFEQAPKEAPDLRFR